MANSRVVTIELTPIINTLIEDYERVRPQSLNASFVIHQPQAEEHLGAQMMDNGAAAAGNAVVGAVAGASAVPAMFIYECITTLKDYLVEKFYGNEKVTAFNLAYLTPITFQDELHHPANAVLNARLSTLQDLYNECCKYQDDKDSRPFSHRDDGTINDPKYLVNIFLGRKIEAAARAAMANDQQAYEQQLAHLKEFIQVISNNKEVLASRSNNSTYISLRNVIVMINTRLSALTADEADILAKDNLLTQARDDIAKITHDSKQFINRTIDAMIKLVCNIKPGDFTLAKKNDPLNQNMDAIKQFENPYPTVLFKAFASTGYEDGLAGYSLDDFIAGLSEHAAFKFEYKQALAIQKLFNEFIKDKNKLFNLINTLELTLDLCKHTANVGLAQITDELCYTLIEIQRLNVKLASYHAKFIEALMPALVANNNQKFSDSIVQYSSFNPHLNNQATIQRAIQVLSELEYKKEGVIAKIEAMAKDLIAKIKAVTAELGFKTSNANANKQAAIFSHAEKSLQESLSSSFVMVDTKNSLRTQLDEVKKENSSLKGEIKQVKKQLTDAEQTARVFQENSAIADKIEVYKSNFKQAITHYLNYNKNCYGLFHYHGNHGQKRALEFLNAFNELLDSIKIDNENISLENLNDIILERFRTLLLTKQETLDGNYHEHSLKNYLLTFGNYLTAGAPVNQKFSLATDDIKAAYKQFRTPTRWIL